MAFTTPATFTVSEVVTAAKLNTHLRDNMQYLKDVLDGVQGQDVTLAVGSTDAVPRVFTVRKARGSIGSPASVAANDVIFETRGVAYNAGAYRSATLIRQMVDTVGATFVTGLIDLYTYRSSDGTALLGARVYNGQLLLSDGSAGTPALGFVSAATTGLARIGATTVSLVGNGIEAFRAGASGATAVVGFYGNTGFGKQNVSGSRGGNAALASLITALATIGLVTDSSTA